MTDDALNNEIQIVCDQTKGHSQKRALSLVTVYRRIGRDSDDAGRWTTHVLSKRVQRDSTAQNGSADTGLTLIGDEVFKVATHGMRPDEVTRSVYQIECNKCHRYPVSAKEETLFEILNHLRDTRISQITLKALAARVSRMDH